MNADPTVRLIFCALVDLFDGHDVMIVAYPADEGARIASTIIAIAKKMEIACANIRTGDGRGPRVKVRAFDGEIPLPTPKCRVHVDHSAVFERQHVVPQAVRTVTT